MSITSLNKKFNQPFRNCVFIDFAIDTDDARKVFNSCDKKFNFDNPNLKLNLIKFDEDIYTRISSFTLYEDEFNEENLEKEWELIERIEIDYCQVLILNEDNLKNDLDDWLESFIKMTELYRIEEDGRVCLISGFGPGIYRLMGIKNDDNKYIACRMEFIKEVAESTN